MPINPDAVGTKSEPARRRWDSKDALIYALGVGAGAADPLDEPPALRARSHGFSVGPYQLESPPPEKARSSMFVIATTSPPARRMRSATTLSSAGT